MVDDWERRRSGQRDVEGGAEDGDVAGEWPGKRNALQGRGRSDVDPGKRSASSQLPPLGQVVDADEQIAKVRSLKVRLQRAIESSDDSDAYVAATEIRNAIDRARQAIAAGRGRGLRAELRAVENEVAPLLQRLPPDDGGKRVQRKVIASFSSDPLERQADAAADAVISGRSARAVVASSAGVGVSRADTAPAGRRAVIVEDDAPAGDGQIHKHDMLVTLETALEEVAQAELGTAWKIVGCPYIQRYLAIYAKRPAADGEAFVRRYTGSTATESKQLMLDLLTKARSGVQFWKQNHKLPADLAAADPNAAQAAGATMPPPAAALAGPAIQQKAAGAEHERTSSDPANVMSRLGEGTALDSATQSRMGSSFGASFADVRIHADEHGGAIAREQNALAFTVGSHVAFAPGRYQPGSVEGDALLAHELTHVLQQRGATAPAPQHKRAGGSEDAAELDADRAAGSVVRSLHGGASEPASASLTSDFKLQRCTGETKIPDDFVHSRLYTLQGDDFMVDIGEHQSVGAQDRPLLDIEINYDGLDDSDGKFNAQLTPLPGKDINPTITTDKDTDWKKLTIDLYGDGSWLGGIEHSSMYLEGWTPKSRNHTFQSFGPGAVAGSIGATTPAIIVKSKNAIPGNAPPTDPVDNTEPRALRIDIAATTVKARLDSLLANKDYALDANQPPWSKLKAAVDADAVKYATAQANASDEALRLTRVQQVLTEVQPMLGALGAASNPNAYLPDIAVDAIADVTEVRNLYASAVDASWSAPAGSQLAAANAAFNALWFRVTSLYLQKGRGVDQLIQNATSLAQDVRDNTGSGEPMYSTIKNAIGVPTGVQGGGTSGTRPDQLQTQAQVDLVRREFMAGTPGSLKKVTQAVDDSQVIAGLASLLVSDQMFYKMKKELASLVGKAADKTPGTRNLTKVCETRIAALEAMAGPVENALAKAGSTEARAAVLRGIGRSTVTQFQQLANTKEYKEDLDDIQSRIKTVKIIETIAKIAAIMGIAALTGGAAGAAVGEALEAAEAGEGVIAAGKFTADVVTFTVMSRAGNNVVFGKNDTGWVEDLATNALMIGSMKALGAIYGKVFVKSAGTIPFKVGGAVTVLAGLQAFAEIHQLIKTGKIMSMDQRLQSLLTNAILMGAMSLGEYLVKAGGKATNAKMLEIAQSNNRAAIDAVSAKIDLIRPKITALKAGGPKAGENAAALIDEVKALWEEELKALADAVAKEKTDKPGAQKAFQDTVDGLNKEIAKLDLQLASTGVELDLSALPSGGNMFHSVQPGIVAYKAGGLDVIREFYAETKGKLEPVPGKADMYRGTDASGETFYIAEEKTETLFDKPKDPATAQDTAAQKAADTEAKDLARIKDAQPGKLRPASELSNADVAKAMNAQLEKVKPGDIDAMMSHFPAEQQAKAREVLGRASGFGRMESMNALRASLEQPGVAGKKLYTPGRGSLADNLTYLANSKKTFSANPNNIATTATIDPNTVVIIDQVVLAQIKADPAFAKSLVDNKAVLIEPRGFTDGVNMFSGASPEAIAQKTSALLGRANAIQAGSKMTFDEAITQALDENTQAALKAANPALAGQLKVVDPASQPDVTSSGLAAQLNGSAGVSEAQVDATLSKVAEADRAALRELLVQQAEVFSTRRIANDLAVQHQKILGLAAARNVKPSNIYFFIAESQKSYGMMAMAHREATGTPVDHYINGPTELTSKALGPDTMLVILDDVAGSGDSLRDAFLDASGYTGQIVVSPMVSTETANQLFTKPGTGLTANNPNLTYVPGRVMPALTESPFFKSLPRPQQDRLVVILNGLGYKDGGLSMAFPYMAPDNNNAMFGGDLAKNFVVNNNQKAVKSSDGWTPGGGSP